ncbi:MAG: T9SS type A sorting domain-containing protein [Bacteroidota bacterium]
MNRIVKAFFPLLIFSMLLAYTGPAIAQGYRVAAASAQAAGVPSDWVQVKIELANISGKDLNLRVEITDRSGLPSDWNTQICFFQNCFPPGSTAHEGTMVTDFKEDIDITFITGANPGTATVKVLVTNLDNTNEKTELTFTAITTLASVPGAPTASDLILSQNYPNPFSLGKYNGTTITYRMAESGNATLKVYNLLGKEVLALVNEMRPIGKSSITWDGRDNTGRQVPAGIYVYKLTTNSQTLSRRMMITR